MSVARCLPDVDQGYQIRGIVDFEQVRKLVRVNGGLGRLGGLLMLLLSDDVRTARFSESTLRALLGRIEATQNQMNALMQKIIRPGAA